MAWLFNATKFFSAFFSIGCSAGETRRERERNKVKSVHLAESGGLWMWSGQLTGRALRAAVKLLGCPCPPGGWEPRRWSRHCACQRAGQLQRGKFKKRFSSFKCNTAKYSTGAPLDQALTASVIVQNRWVFTRFLFRGTALFVRLLSPRAIVYSLAIFCL